MTRRLIIFCGAVMALSCGQGCAEKAGRTGGPRASDLVKAIEQLRPLHELIREPVPGDWLSRHKEQGQTFKQYVRGNPVTARDGNRRVIYIQPLGDFTKSEQKVLDLTVDFMGRFYNVPVAVQPRIPLSRIPDEARRVHPSWGDQQILTTYVLYDVLKPRLPKDAVAYLAFTPSDLWPGKGWNFVFGQASLKQRVGVWSIYRYGDPDKSREDFELFLMRTLKVAVHETGHMFSMLHCTRYECGMCGSNHMAESDSRPIYFCPECMPKVCWATRADRVDRLRSLAEFCEENGFTREAAFYTKSAETLAKQQRDGKKRGDSQPR